MRFYERAMPIEPPFEHGLLRFVVPGATHAVRGIASDERHEPCGPQESEFVTIAQKPGETQNRRHGSVAWIRFPQMQ